MADLSKEGGNPGRRYDPVMPACRVEVRRPHACSRLRQPSTRSRCSADTTVWQLRRTFIALVLRPEKKKKKKKMKDPR